MDDVVGKFDAPYRVAEGLLLARDVGVGAGRVRGNQALEQELVLPVIDRAARRVGVAFQRLDRARQQCVVIDLLNHRPATPRVPPAISYCAIYYQTKAETALASRLRPSLTDRIQAAARSSRASAALATLSPRISMMRAAFSTSAALLGASLPFSR